jgi:hypothetical protein
VKGVTAGARHGTARHGTAPESAPEPLLTAARTANSVQSPLCRVSSRARWHIGGGRSTAAAKANPVRQTMYGHEADADGGPRLGCAACGSAGVGYDLSAACDGPDCGSIDELRKVALATIDWCPVCGLPFNGADHWQAAPGHDGKTRRGTRNGASAKLRRMRSALSARPGSVPVCPRHGTGRATSDRRGAPFTRDRPGRGSPRKTKKSGDFPVRKPGEPCVTNVTRKLQFHLLRPHMIT